MKPKRAVLLLLALAMVLSLAGCREPEKLNDTPPDIWPGELTSQTAASVPESPVPNDPLPDAGPSDAPRFNYVDIPAYDGLPWTEVNGSTPYFTGTDLVGTSFEAYSSLDELGRCGTAYACVGTDTMPDEDRGYIGMVRPSGWHTATYPDIIPEKYLYNRCHLIGHQLTGEDANERNLVTGTRAMNIDGMLPFENQVAEYVGSTGNHVLYRVTPVFVDDELVARGVLMEGYSVEDLGYGICFCVFAYNVQPGIIIDYATGDSREDPDYVPETPETATYVLNTNTRRFHLPDCEAVSSISEKNRDDTSDDRAGLVARGYLPCGICNP